MMIGPLISCSAAATIITLHEFVNCHNTCSMEAVQPSVRPPEKIMQSSYVRTYLPCPVLTFNCFAKFGGWAVYETAITHELAPFHTMAHMSNVFSSVITTFERMTLQLWQLT